MNAPSLSATFPITFTTTPAFTALCEALGQPTYEFNVTVDPKLAAKCVRGIRRRMKGEKGPFRVELQEKGESLPMGCVDASLIRVNGRVAWKSGESTPKARKSPQTS